MGVVWGFAVVIPLHVFLANDWVDTWCTALGSEFTWEPSFQRVKGALHLGRLVSLAWMDRSKRSDRCTFVVNEGSGWTACSDTPDE